MGRIDLIGQTIGQYRVIEEFGQGGTAQVFRAFDELNARDVAMKALLIEADDRTSFMQRFEREAQVIRSLHHPNIVEVYDYDKTDSFVYLVLRLLDRRTLRHRIAQQRPSIASACQYMIQIAHALHHAHQQGIIHRDVKPSNILFDPDQPEHTLLTDFGTAKIQYAQGLTRTGATIGTPEYMSPEQAKGEEVDQRSDIYSLGCALYEALTGRPPFLGSAPVSVLFQQVHVQPTYIRSINPDVPRELWEVVHRCLAKRADDRYGSAAILAEALQPFADGLIQPTPPPRYPTGTGRPATGGLAEPIARPERDWPSQPLTPPPFPLPPTPLTADANGVFDLSELGPNPVWPAPLDLSGVRAPDSRPVLAPRGPEPSVTIRATAGPRSGLLSGGSVVSHEAQQAIAAFAETLDMEEPQTLEAPVQPSVLDDYPTTPTPVYAQQAQQAQQWRGQTGAPYSTPASDLDGYGGPGSGGFDRYRDPVGRGFDDYRGPGSGVFDDYPTPASGALDEGHRGPNSGSLGGPRRTMTAAPVVVENLRGDYNQQMRRPGRAPLSPLVKGGMAVVALLLAAALGMGGVKLFAQQSAPAHPTPRASVGAVRATATATVAQPTATATLTAQQTLDQQAASAFRAITLAPFSDSACSSASMTTHYTGGPVYINLCMASSRPPGTVTVVVRQSGSVVRTLISNLTPHAGSFYTQGHTLSAGSYDMLVTMQINGKQAVAQDIAFTVA